MNRMRSYSVPDEYLQLSVYRLNNGEPDFTATTLPHLQAMRSNSSPSYKHGFPRWFTSSPYSSPYYLDDQYNTEMSRLAPLYNRTNTATPDSVFSNKHKDDETSDTTSNTDLDSAHSYDTSSHLSQFNEDGYQDMHLLTSSMHYNTLTRQNIHSDSDDNNNIDSLADSIDKLTNNKIKIKKCPDIQQYNMANDKEHMEKIETQLQAQQKHITELEKKLETTRHLNWYLGGLSLFLIGIFCTIVTIKIYQFTISANTLSSNYPFSAIQPSSVSRPENYTVMIPCLPDIPTIIYIIAQNST